MHPQRMVVKFYNCTNTKGMSMDTKQSVNDTPRISVYAINIRQILVKAQKRHSSVDVMNNYSMKQPDRYYFEGIEMMTQSQQNFEWKIRGIGKYSLWILTRLVTSFLWLRIV